MDPDQINVEDAETWSESDSIQEDGSASNLRPESDNTNEDAENIHMDSPSSHITKSESEPKEFWEMESEHLSGGEEDVSHWEQEDDKSLSSPAPDMTLALILHQREDDLQEEADNSQSGGTASPRVQSPEGGGSSDAPPACVSFGISEEGAEQAQRWDLGSDTDLCRPNRHRARHTRLSQSERHVKETKSKCKRIALLLTHAPNPCNKGALLFKKRRQRVENYTFTSYGTGKNFDSEDQIEEAEDITAYNFESTSDSELEEEYSVYHQQSQYRNRNWQSQQKMEGLPETQGKGALMFAQRRKRMDEIVSEHEELRSKGLPVEGPQPKSEPTAPPKIYEPDETYVYSGQDNYTEQPVDFQEENTNVPKPLVPNRTAKPFLGFQVNAPPPARHSVVVPVTPVKKKPEPKFKVPVHVPSNVSPHVWSPTGDIIASRDERISVPAIRTGILPEVKRKGSSKQSPPEQKASLQNKGDRRSFIECEEDCFSLGAEACNFMQPKTIKLKNPPPVAPKPTINPACPPWMVKAALDDPYVPAQPSSTAIGPYSQHNLHDRAKPQQMSNHWAQDQTPARLQTSTNMSSQLHPQPTANSWSLQQSRSPVFGRSRAMSLPRQLSVVSSPGQSPVPGTRASVVPRRQTYFQEKPFKPLTPWEAASRSPIGSVDEAFMFPSSPSSIVSSVKAAGHRRSLPEPPEEWKRRVSLDPAPVTRGHYQVAPALQAPSTSRTFLPERRIFFGSALPHRANVMGQNTFPYSPLYGPIRNPYC